MEKEKMTQQKRYYSVKELYRKYSLHLKKTAANDITEYERKLCGIEQYLHWMGVQSLTVYMMTQERVLEFFKYLFDYRHPNMKNLYYTRQTLRKKLKSIYDFHQWLEGSSIVVENIFSKPLRGQLGLQIRSRDAPVKDKPLDQRIAKKFQKIYQEAHSVDLQRGYTQTTLREHKNGWRLFFEWLESHGIKEVKAVNERVLIDYQNYLLGLKHPMTGHLITDVVRLRKLIAVKRLFEYLRLLNYIRQDYSYAIELPKCRRGVGRVLMTPAEVEKFLSLPDVSTRMGLRDRAIMEVFFSTGVRLNELCHIKVEDILFDEGMVRVMVPKGGIAFQRVIPIGEVALEWVKNYLSRVHSLLVKYKQHHYLFINTQGRPIRKESVLGMMRHYRFVGGFRKKITSHSWRVTCATEMLRRRADIRYVQAQLGHTQIQSTQIYTRVLPTDLKKVHQKTHPRGRKRDPLLLSSI